MKIESNSQELNKIFQSLPGAGSYPASLLERRRITGRGRFYERAHKECKECKQCDCDCCSKAPSDCCNCALKKHFQR